MAKRSYRYSVKLTREQAFTIKTQLEIRAQSFHRVIKEALNEKDPLSRMKEGDTLIEAWRNNEKLCAEVAAIFGAK